MLLLFSLSLPACLEESADGLPQPVNNSRVFEFSDKILYKAMTNILKERGFEDPKVDADQGTVETGYLVQDNFRTKVEARVKKIGRRDHEVTLLVVTEQNTPSGWKAKKIMEKAQYDKFFDEIEIQAYRELSKGE
jgi:hypothetical protein